MRYRDHKTTFHLILTFIFMLVYCSSPMSGFAQELAAQTSLDMPSSSTLAQEVMATAGIETKISMDVQDASFKDILKIFSQQSGLNFVASADVEGLRITMYLEDVTIQDAMENIIKANKLTYERLEHSNIVMIKRSYAPEIELVTNVYTLHYARLSGSRLASSAGQAGGGGGTAVGIDAIISQLLSGNGSMVVDTVTNSLIITDVPTQFKRIEEVLCKLDVRTPQILIEAEIVDTTADALKWAGIEWGASDGSFLSVNAGSRGTSWPFTTDQKSTVATTLTAGTINGSNIKATLRLLDSVADTHILARPKLLVLNNESATINIMTDAALAVTVERTLSEGTAATSETIERGNVGVSLTVTPQVNQDGFITMVLRPEVSGVTASSLTTTDGGTIYDKVERATSTVIRVRSDQTAVLAGLINQEDTVTKKEVPGLGKLPIIGRMFQDDKDDSFKRELLIFITPHIVDTGSEYDSTEVATTSFSDDDWGSFDSRTDIIDQALDAFDK